MSCNGLSICNLSKHFAGVYALKKASIEFHTGEIHALLGGNGAGKSTMCKMLSGALKPDDGSISINGRTFNGFTPKQAKENGIGMIYQEFNLVPEMMVYENIFLGKEIRKGLDTNKEAMIKRTGEIFDSLGVQIDPYTKIADLSVAYCQLVEIGKAILEDAKILIMDEPTATLTSSEIDALFDLVRILKSRGVAIIYISHRINEIMSITDKVTVMRDGELVSTLNTSNTTRDELIRLMVKRDLGSEFPKINPSTVKDEVLLKVENLTTKKISNISFELHRGEILGLAGLVGSGRTETLRAIFGADPIISGDIYIRGKKVKIKSPQDSIAIGIGMIPEDRKRQGAHLELPIYTNISLTKLRDLSVFFTTQSRKIKELVNKFVEVLSIKVPSTQSHVSSLSGGNQQKVVLAKWLAIKSDILFFDEPTRGIDVGTKKEIYDLMDDLRKQGKGIIMVSSEMPEIIGMSNKIIVLYEGIKKGEVPGGIITQEQIMNLASDEHHN